MRGKIPMNNELASLESMIYDQFNLVMPKQPTPETIPLLLKEVDRVKMQWLRVATSVFSDEMLRRYVKHHQLTLSRIAFVIQAYIQQSEKRSLYPSLEGVHPSLPAFTLAIEELEIVIETHFLEFLERDCRFPVCCLRQLTSKVRSTLPELSAAMEGAGINQNLKEAILKPFQELIQDQANQKIMLSRQFLLRETIEHLEEIVKMGYAENDFTELIIKRLCYTNFNTPDVVSAITESLLQKVTENASKPAEQLIKLKDLHSHFAGMPTAHFLQFDGTNRQLVSLVAENLLKEIEKRESSLENMTTRVKQKIKINLTVHAIGLWLRLWFDTGIFDERENRRNVVNVIISNFAPITKKGEDAISNNSLYNAMYEKNNRNTNIAMRRLLRRKIEILDHLIDSKKT